MMIFPIIFCFGLFVSSSYGINYDSLPFHGGNYKAHWKFDNETKIFHFKVEVNATGWVAFGVSRLMYPTNPDLQWNFHAMEYYDVIVGGVFGNNSKYFKVSKGSVLCRLLHSCCQLGLSVEANSLVFVNNVCLFWPS